MDVSEIYDRAIRAPSIDGFQASFPESGGDVDDEHIDGESRASVRAAIAGLTDREVEVVRLVAEGLSDRAIAERLVISTRTVDSHMRHIYNKVDVSSRVELTVWSIGTGLVHAEATGLEPFDTAYRSERRSGGR